MAYSYGWEPFKTSLILDAIDMAEYDELNDVNRDRVVMIIGAGTINFREGSPMWNILHSLFPDGSITWEALKLSARHEYNVSLPLS